MQQPWHAEHLVDVACLRRLLAVQFPALAEESISPLAEGWDNACFLVGTNLIFRLPRRAVGADLMDHENALLPTLAPRLPLPIPVPQHIGAPQGDYPWSFHGYRQLAG